MTTSEKTRILTRVAEVKAIGRPSAVHAFVAGHTGNSLNALRRALNLPTMPVPVLRARIIATLLDSEV